MNIVMVRGVAAPKPKIKLVNGVNCWFFSVSGGGPLVVHIV